MAYEFPRDGGLDYFPCAYGASRVLFRGPQRPLDGVFVAALGGAETYGKFVEYPYPALLEEALGLPVANLAQPSAGPDLYLNDPSLLDIASRAAVVVVQVLGAGNLSNRYYSVHPRRNDRFLGATPQLRALYPKVDFTEFNFTRHMLNSLFRADPRRFATLAAELRATWISRMQALLGQIRSRVILCALGQDALPQVTDLSKGLRDPLLVDMQMVRALQPKVEAMITLAPSAASLALGQSDMIFSPTERAAAEELPNAAFHAEIAEALVPIISDRV